MKTEKSSCVIAAVVFGCIFTIIAARVAWYFGELQLKSDNAHTRSNLVRVYRRLEQYHNEHGTFPPQQDMKSLLETLGMNESDFEKVRFFDIKSAEYHAPQGEITSPDDWQNPILTIRVRHHVFGKSELYIVRRDGSEYTANEADLKIAVDPK